MLRRQLTDTTGYLLSVLEKNEQGQYFFPCTPCGILPFWINQENKIVWGCVETNRTGIISTLPPTGSQDLIVIKDNERLAIELSKPLPDLKKDFLEALTGKNSSGQIYQEIITRFIENGYQVYLETMLAAAVRETLEENGIDLQIENGKNLGLLISMFDFPPQVVKAKRGMITQKIYAAYLSGNTGIELRYTDKIEEKILMNKDHSFYEKGIWCTLEYLKESFQDQKNNFSKDGKYEFNEEQIKLMESEFVAWESRIQLIEKIESSIIQTFKNLNINSIAQLSRIDFGIMEYAAARKDQLNEGWTRLTLLGGEEFRENQLDSNLASNTMPCTASEDKQITVGLHS